MFPNRNENGSVGMMAYFLLGLVAALFIYVLMTGMFDRLVATHEVTADLGTDFPVSDERVQTLNFLVIAMGVAPFMGILVPLIIYSVVISVRKGSGGI